MTRRVFLTEMLYFNRSQKTELHSSMASINTVLEMPFPYCPLVFASISPALRALS